MDDWEAAASSWVPTTTTLPDTSLQTPDDQQEPIPEEIPAVVSEPFNVKRMGTEATLRSLGVTLNDDGKPDEAAKEEATASSAHHAATTTVSHAGNNSAAPPLPTPAAAATAASAINNTKSAPSAASAINNTKSAPSAGPAINNTKSAGATSASSASSTKAEAASSSKVTMAAESAHDVDTRRVVKLTSKLKSDWWYYISDISVVGTVAVKREALGGGETPAATTEYQLRVTSRQDTWTVCHSHGAFKELLEELSAEDKTFRDISISRQRASLFSIRRYTGRLAAAHREAEAKALTSIRTFMDALMKNHRKNCAWGFVQMFLQPYSRADTITQLADGGALGWMWKKGHHNTAWKPRFIAVCGRTLYYYVGRLTQRQGHVPLVEIKDVTTTTAEPGPDRPGRVVLQLHCPDRVWNLCASSPETTMKWNDIFKSRISKSNKIMERINSKKQLRKT